MVLSAARGKSPDRANAWSVKTAAWKDRSTQAILVGSKRFLVGSIMSTRNFTSPGDKHALPDRFRRRLAQGLTDIFKLELG